MLVGMNDVRGHECARSPRIRTRSPMATALKYVRAGVCGITVAWANARCNVAGERGPDDDESLGSFVRSESSEDVQVVLVAIVKAQRHDRGSVHSQLPADSRPPGRVLPVVVGGGRGGQAVELQAVGALHQVPEVSGRA